jgi:hypothetical protein
MKLELLRKNFFLPKAEDEQLYVRKIVEDLQVLQTVIFVHSLLQRREWIIFRNVYVVIRNKKVNGKLCESFLHLN